MGMRGAFRAVTLAALTGVAACLLPTPAGARTEGPFTAQIVDAETGAPVAGVVVVALYEKKSPGWVHPETSFYDLDETVTDAEGHFSFSARSLPISTPLSHIVGPEFIIFKSGYKGWKFKGVEAGRHVDPQVREEQHEEGWRKFRGPGVVIELGRANTRQDHESARGSASYFPPIPDDRAPRLRKALDDESAVIQRLRERSQE